MYIKLHLNSLVYLLYIKTKQEKRLGKSKDGVNLLSVNELQKYTLIKIFNFSIILLSFLCHVKIL